MSIVEIVGLQFDKNIVSRLIKPINYIINIYFDSLSENITEYIPLSEFE